MNLKVLLAAPIVAFLVIANAAEMKRPANWSWTASSNGDQDEPGYEMGVDDQVLYQGHRSLTLRGQRKSDISYTAAIQYVSARGYEGKKVRFSGVLRSTGVDTWAGIWARSDASGHDLFSGTTLPPAQGFGQSVPQWTPLSVVLEVGPKDSQIAMGLALVGNGQAWLSDLHFEMVDDTVPVTTTRPAIDLAKYQAYVAERDKRTTVGPLRATPQNLELSTR